MENEDCLLVLETEERILFCKALLLYLSLFCLHSSLCTVSSLSRRLSSLRLLRLGLSNTLYSTE